MRAISLDELAPKVNFASRDRAGAGVCWGPRVIPDCQLFYVISGKAELVLGAASYRILPGECAFYGRDSPHLLRTLSWTEYYSIHFDWSAPSAAPIHPAHGIRNVNAAELKKEPLSYQLDCPGYGSIDMRHHLPMTGAEPLMMRLVREYQREQIGSSFMLRALLSELLAAIVRQTAERRAVHRPGKVDAALQAIRENPAKAWSVSELAELCGYHPSYFTTLFFREVGQKPKQFLISERMKLAKQGLLRGEPIESLAQRLGYGSIHYFSNHFKKETGLSPSEFRQRPDQDESDELVKEEKHDVE